jgi:hypothetical protein
MDWKKILTEEQKAIIKTIEAKEVDFFIRHDMGELTDKEHILFFLYLINTGLVWKLEGKLTRQAMRLVGGNFLSLSFDTTKFKQAASKLNIYEKLLIRLEPKKAIKLWQKDNLSREKVFFLLEHLNRSGQHLWREDANAENAIANGLRHQYFFVVPNFEKLNDGGG